MNTYVNGQPVRLTVTFTVADVNTDPATVTIKLKDPTGAITSYTYAGGQVVKDSTGVYHYDATPSTDGLWWWRAEGTGAATAATEDQFFVKSSFL